ncbi:MAG TPA: hypothetical protein VIK14_04820 [Ignavibacteria bacterium]
MKIPGSIDDQNQLWTRMTIVGTKSFDEIDCIIDTGFNGELVLPINIAVPLGLELSAYTEYTLGDGSKVPTYLFSGKIHWGTVKKDVTICVFRSGDPLLGGGLLNNYVLIANFKSKILSISEPDEDTPDTNDPDIDNP